MSANFADNIKKYGIFLPCLYMHNNVNQLLLVEDLFLLISQHLEKYSTSQLKVTQIFKFLSVQKQDSNVNFRKKYIFGTFKKKIKI